mgnify:CR=1 FL=1
MRTIEMKNLWGETVLVPVSEARHKPTVARGYAAPPGTGPEGEKCQTCRHRVSTGNTPARTYWKCGLMRNSWTSGPATDIKVRTPACRRWERDSE